MPNPKDNRPLRQASKALIKPIFIMNRFEEGKVIQVVPRKEPYLQKIDRYFKYRRTHHQELKKISLNDRFPFYLRVLKKDLKLLNNFCRLFDVILVRDKRYNKLDLVVDTYTLVGFEYDVDVVLAFMDSYLAKITAHRKRFKTRLKRLKERHKQISLEKRQLFKDKRSLFFRCLYVIYTQFCWEILDNCPNIRKKGPKIAELGTRIAQEKFFKFRRDSDNQKYWHESIGKKYRQVFYRKIKYLTPDEENLYRSCLTVKRDRFTPEKPFKRRKRRRPQKPKAKTARKRAALEYLRKIKSGEIPD